MIWSEIMLIVVSAISCVWWMHREKAVVPFYALYCGLIIAAFHMIRVAILG